MKAGAEVEVVEAVELEAVEVEVLEVEEVQAVEVKAVEMEVVDGNEPHRGVPADDDDGDTPPPRELSVLTPPGDRHHDHQAGAYTRPLLSST